MHSLSLQAVGFTVFSCNDTAADIQNICLLPLLGCLSVIQMLLTQSNCFNNRAETKRPQKKRKRKNKVSSTIQWSLILSPDSCSVQYSVSKKAYNNSTHRHTHTSSISPTNASPSKGNDTSK